MLKKETWSALGVAVGYIVLVAVFLGLMTGCSTLTTAAKYCIQYPDHCR